MNFFRRFFRKKIQEPDFEEEWDKLVFSRENVDFSDEKDRSRYVTQCLEQILEASRETDLLMGEYTLVTKHLADTEEIDALPEAERQELEKSARMIQNLSEEKDRLGQDAGRMEDDLYYRMQSREEEIEEGIAKLQEAEEYAGLVKEDLKRLHRESSAYQYRKQELQSMCDNLKGMTNIFFAALGICLTVFLILYAMLQMKVLMGCFLALIAAAIAITVTCIKYVDAKRELLRVNRDINKLIALQNKVKIRYVNNTNLLAYLRMKYSVDNSHKLKSIWAQYKKEQELRRQTGENQAKLEFYQEKLVSQLTRCRVNEPTKWLAHTSAILDPREMVEVRHELILRRQALRKQMEYNEQVAKNARSEVMEVANLYPSYAPEILKMLDAYDDDKVDPGE